MISAAQIPLVRRSSCTRSRPTFSRPSPTRPGSGCSDQWHGTAYEYYLDNNLNANTWQNNFSGIPNPSFHYSRFGGAIGGPIIPKKILGGKTYFFANYEGFRFPAVDDDRKSRSFGSDAAWACCSSRCQWRDAGLQPQPHARDLQRRHVHAGASVPAGPCDPRGIGINPLVQQMWNKYMPLSNETGCGLGRCDGLNVLGFTANMSTPQTSNFGVARLDHDFGDKWHFMSSYRYYNLTSASTQQVDIGGFFPATRWAFRRLSPTIRSSRGSWSLALTANLTNNMHQRHPLQLPAQLVAVGQGGRPGAIPRSGRSAGALRRNAQPRLCFPTTSIHAADSYPFLGWPGQHDPR